MRTDGSAPRRTTNATTSDSVAAEAAAYSWIAFHSPWYSNQSAASPTQTRINQTTVRISVRLPRR
jgi:hypothetical protein